MNTLPSSLGLALWMALCFGAPAVGAFTPPGAWYAELRKPAWNPPNWIFGPVWTVLYLLMAVAAWLVWCRGGFAAQRLPLTLFLVQLAFNAAWTPCFFGARNPALALADIVLLWLSLLATVVTFFRVQPGAGWLLVPYLAWVSFAALLNFTLWRMNP